LIINKLDSFVFIILPRDRRFSTDKLIFIFIPIFIFIFIPIFIFLFFVESIILSEVFGMPNANEKIFWMYTTGFD